MAIACKIAKLCLFSRAEALFLQTNQVSIPLKSEIVAFATEQRLPSVSSRRDFAAAVARRTNSST